MADKDKTIVNPFEWFEEQKKKKREEEERSHVISFPGAVSVTQKIATQQDPAGTPTVKVDITVNNHDQSLVPATTSVTNSNQESVKQEDTNYDSSSTSPFDQIRHLDDNGNEYWSARELQELLGYTEWRNFSKAINKAKENFEAVGIIVEEQLVKVNKLSKRNNGAEVEVEDYRLTRRACYTVAVCCDANKPEVAAAKQYFVIRTRQAEVAQQVVEANNQQPLTVPRTPGQMLMAMGQALIATEERIDKKISGIEIQVQGLISTDDKLQQQIDQLTKQIQSNSSTASVLTEESSYDPISAEGLTTVADMADILHDRFGYEVGRNNLYDWLVNNKMIIRYKNKGHKATKKFEDIGWFVTETETVNSPFSSNPIQRYKVWITQKGRQGIVARYGLSNS